MELENLLEVKNRDEFREWLMRNHKIEKECWAFPKRGRQTEEEALWYLDAVEEALCFGWIDSTLKKLDDGRAVNRFSPRSRKSPWTELNKERVRRLEKLGKMTDAGRAILPDMSPEGFVIDSDILRALQEDEQVYQTFLAFPPLYQRVRIDNIQKNKLNPLMFQSRLEKLIENTKQGIMFGDWNDNGRLLNY